MSLWKHCTGKQRYYNLLRIREDKHNTHSFQRSCFLNALPKHCLSKNKYGRLLYVFSCLVWWYNAKGNLQFEMHSPEKMLQIAKVGYLQIFHNVNIISSRTAIIPLMLTILNSNKATNSSELLRIGGNTFAINFFPVPAMLPHPAPRCTSEVPSSSFPPSLLRSWCWILF